MHGCMARGRPLFVVRMDEPQIQHLREVARLAGHPDASSFVREMFTAMLSPDVGERMNYVHRLSVKLGEQLTLPLSEAARTTRTARKTRKKRRPRERRE